MKILLALLIFSLFFISNNISADSKEYILKDCKNYQDAQSCSICKNFGKVSFKIDKSLASVLILYKLDTGLTDTALIENCKIFDEETFVCEDENYGEHGYIITKKLTNGVYTDILENFGDNSRMRSWNYCAVEIRNILNWLK